MNRQPLPNEIRTQIVDHLRACGSHVISTKFQEKRNELEQLRNALREKNYEETAFLDWFTLLEDRNVPESVQMASEDGRLSPFVMGEIPAIIGIIRDGAGNSIIPGSTNFENDSFDQTRSTSSDINEADPDGQKDDIITATRSKNGGDATNPVPHLEDKSGAGSSIIPGSTNFENDSFDQTRSTGSGINEADPDGQKDDVIAATRSKNGGDATNPVPHLEDTSVDIVPAVRTEDGGHVAKPPWRVRKDNGMDPTQILDTRTRSGHVPQKARNEDEISGRNITPEIDARNRIPTGRCKLKGGHSLRRASQKIELKGVCAPRSAERRSRKAKKQIHLMQENTVDLHDGDGGGGGGCFAESQNGVEAYNTEPDLTKEQLRFDSLGRWLDNTEYLIILNNFVEFDILHGTELSTEVGVATASLVDYLSIMSGGDWKQIGDTNITAKIGGVSLSYTEFQYSVLVRRVYKVVGIQGQVLLHTRRSESAPFRFHWLKQDLASDLTDLRGRFGNIFEKLLAQARSGK